MPPVKEMASRGHLRSITFPGGENRITDMSEDAENKWAMTLTKLGYTVQVENMRGAISVFA